MGAEGRFEVEDVGPDPELVFIDLYKTTAITNASTSTAPIIKRGKFRFIYDLFFRDVLVVVATSVTCGCRAPTPSLTVGLLRLSPALTRGVLTFE